MNKIYENCKEKATHFFPPQKGLPFLKMNSRTSWCENTFLHHIPKVNLANNQKCLNCRIYVFGEGIAWQLNGILNEWFTGKQKNQCSFGNHLQQNQ